MTRLRIIHLCLHGHNHESPLPLGIDSDTGGQTIYFHQLSLLLSHCGHKQFEFIFHTRHDGIKNSYPGKIPLKWGPGRYLKKEALLKFLPDCSAEIIRQHEDAIRKGQLMIHAHYMDAGIVALNLKKESRVPFLYTPHSLAKGKLEQKAKFHSRIETEKQIIKAASGVIVSSEQERKLVLQYSSKAKVYVIPPGFDLLPKAETSGLGKLKQFAGKKTFVLVAGRRGKDGHSKKLLESITEIPVVVVGGASKVQVKKNIFYTPSLPHKKLLGLMELAKKNNGIALNPVRYEPFGFFIMESVAKGLPVVLYENSGAYEFIPKKMRFPIDRNNVNASISKALKAKKSPDLNNIPTWENHLKSYFKILSNL